MEEKKCDQITHPTNGLPHVQSTDNRGPKPGERAPVLPGAPASVHEASGTGLIGCHNMHIP